MDSVSKNLAVLFLLVYYSSQVETQDQGMAYSVTVRCIATYLRISMQVSICNCWTEQEFQTMVSWVEGSSADQLTTRCSV